MVVAQDRFSLIFVDVTINNPDPVKHAELIRSVLDLSPVAKKFLILLKFWSNRQTLTKLKGCMASLGYTTIGIYFLQFKKVIPNLFGQDGNRLSDGELKSLKEEIEQEDAHSLKDLLKEFFEYFGFKYDYETAVVSIRAASLLTKADLGWSDRKVENNGIIRQYFCIEDPFDTKVNIGLSLEKPMRKLMLLSFQHAFKVIDEDGIESLFEPYEEITEIREKNAAWGKVKKERRKERRGAYIKESVD